MIQTPKFGRVLAESSIGNPWENKRSKLFFLIIKNMKLRFGNDMWAKSGF